MPILSLGFAAFQAAFEIDCKGAANGGLIVASAHRAACWRANRRHRRPLEYVPALSLMYSAAATLSASANINVAVATSDIGPVLLLLECTNSSGYPHDAAFSDLPIGYKTPSWPRYPHPCKFSYETRLSCLMAAIVSGRASIA
jgi:hypothetical protein